MNAMTCSSTTAVIMQYVLTLLGTTAVNVNQGLREMGLTTVRVSILCAFYVHQMIASFSGLLSSEACGLGTRLTRRLTLCNIYYTDVDECNDTQLNKCSENAICTNTPGNYNCQCNESYMGNGFNCEKDIPITDLQYILIL